MSEEHRRIAYLEALSRIQPQWAHEARQHLGGLGLQVELIVATLAKRGGDAELIAELKPILERAQAGVRNFRDAIDRQFSVWSRNAESDLLDLCSMVSRLGALLEPSAKNRYLKWSVVVPAGTLWIEGAEPALREALTIAAIETLYATPEKNTLTLQLEARNDEASLRLIGTQPPSEDAPWLSVVRETLARFGGKAGARGDLEFELIIPMAAVPR